MAAHAAGDDIYISISIYLYIWVNPDAIYLYLSLYMATHAAGDALYIYLSINLYFIYGHARGWKCYLKLYL